MSFGGQKQGQASIPVPGVASPGRRSVAPHSQAVWPGVRLWNEAPSPCPGRGGAHARSLSAQTGSVMVFAASSTGSLHDGSPCGGRESRAHPSRWSWWCGVTVLHRGSVVTCVCSLTGGPLGKEGCPDPWLCVLRVEGEAGGVDRGPGFGVGHGDVLCSRHGKRAVANRVRSPIWRAFPLPRQMCGSPA